MLQYFELLIVEIWRAYKLSLLDQGQQELPHVCLDKISIYVKTAAEWKDRNTLLQMLDVQGTATSQYAAEETHVSTSNCVTILVVEKQKQITNLMLVMPGDKYNMVESVEQPGSDGTIYDGTLVGSDSSLQVLFEHGSFRNMQQSRMPSQNISRLMRKFLMDSNALELVSLDVKLVEPRASCGITSHHRVKNNQRISLVAESHEILYKSNEEIGDGIDNDYICLQKETFEDDVIEIDHETITNSFHHHGVVEKVINEETEAENSITVKEDQSSTSNEELACFMLVCLRLYETLNSEEISNNIIIQKIYLWLLCMELFEQDTQANQHPAVQQTSETPTSNPAVYLKHGELSNQADEMHDASQLVVCCDALQNPDDTDEKDTEEKLEHEKVLSGLHTNQPIADHTDLIVNVAPQYGDNHNPNLPVALQQLLDRMSPQEFLNHVLNELTLEQREALMCDEAQRRRTFLVSWPHTNSNNLSGIAMARAGLYSLGDYDHVQCVFCRGRLNRWEPDDEPMIEHARLFNFCRYVKGLSCGNIEYKSSDFSPNDLQHVTRFGGHQRETTQRGVDGGALGISTTRAAAIRYAPRNARLHTFDRWPMSNALTPESLCDAGFHYTGFDDQVRCFFCAGGLRDWAESDDPWEEHARWFPNCLFLINIKGQDYIKEVHERTPADKKCDFMPDSQLEQRSVSHRRRRRTNQEEMRSFLLGIGHGSDAIDEVIHKNGEPFDDIKDMIEALYALEESNVPHDRLDTAHAAQPRNRGAAHQRENHELMAATQSENVIAAAAESNESTRNQNNCKICNSTTATHVGLPCGHLIYCDECNATEATKSSSSNYTTKCPQLHCSATLNGTIKVYFA